MTAQIIDLTEHRNRASQRRREFNPWGLVFYAAVLGSLSFWTLAGIAAARYWKGIGPS